VLRPVVSARHLSWKIQGTFRVNAPQLFIIGYEAARANIQLVAMRAFDRLICDEAHRAASAKGFRQTIANITVPKRWFLTATPIVNGIKDIEHLFELLGVPDAKEIASDIETLKPYVKELVMARTMDQLRSSIPDAPPKPIVTRLSLPFETEEESEFYNGMAGGIVKRWKAVDGDGGAGSALLKLKLFMRLRQLSLHPQVYIEARRAAGAKGSYERPDWTGSSTKFEAIKRLIKAEPGHKWIIFCHFRPEMDILKRTFDADPLVKRTSVYNGSLTHSKRKELLDATHEPIASNESEILLVQLQSGGVGLNLQHFDRIIFTGPWWTAALMEQAVGRAVRIGQREVVKVFNVVLKDEETINIDSVMTEKAAEKGALCKTVLAEAFSDV